MKFAAVLASVASVATAYQVGAPVEWTSVHNTTARGSLRFDPVKNGLCDPTVDSVSGYFDIDDTTDKHYFFWGFNSRNDPAKDPVIVWLTGGPGCSSELALLVENGPCTPNKGGQSTSLNPYSWNSNATLLYVDQPAGTGFSYSDLKGYDDNEDEVSEDMFNFLVAFFNAYPHLKDNDFYIVGESYAGHYVPSVAHKIYLENKKAPGTINLKGMSVGNGLTDPQVQYSYYGEYAYNFTQQKLGKPIISLKDYEAIQAAIPKCIDLITKCQTGSDLECNSAQSFCNRAMMSAYQESGMNVYDIRKKCVGSLCYDFSDVDTFLNLPSTLADLNVDTSKSKWSECNMQVNQKFSSDWMKDYQEQIVDLLASNIQVLIYAGDCDFICNFIGNKHWTLQLDWDGQAQFSAAADIPWVLGGKEVALVRSFKNFAFMQIHDAGHMVPMDQPVVSLTMINMFINNQPWPTATH